MKIRKLIIFITLLVIPVVLIYFVYKIAMVDSYKNILFTNNKSNEDIELLVKSKKRIEISHGLT